ncbi:hypothetical protein B484DRAFT_445012 [Ochromonadaceae sp. CCMP2298]|nr:hypothetical protein B484DRAFT_445012 [Ochromonadaceae sp. CCMP2298]
MPVFGARAHDVHLALQSLVLVAPVHLYPVHLYPVHLYHVQHNPHVHQQLPAEEECTGWRLGAEKPSRALWAGQSNTAVCLTPDRRAAEHQ